MRISIYQPRYFPQLHYFNRALSSEVFVILDSAQYTKALVHNTNGKKERYKSFQSDTVIKLPAGTHFLTIPIKHNGLLPINQTAMDYSSDWARKHSVTIDSAYRKAKFHSEIYPQIQKLLLLKYETLGELNVATFLWGMSVLLGLKLDLKNITLDKVNAKLEESPHRLKKIILGSALQSQRPKGRQMGTQWTVEICKELGATEYVHGDTAQAGYMDDDYYHKNSIELITQTWKCAEYPQQFSDKTGFIPNLSIVDLLLNADANDAMKIVGDK